MVTIKEVAEKWDEKHPTCKTENLEPDEKAKFGQFRERHGREAVIKLSNDYPYEPWGERTCYVFTSNYDKSDKPINIQISFQRRTKESPDTQAFYEFLERIIIGNSNFKVSKGKINPNHLVLKRVFPIDSSAQDICDGMEELIELTQKPICEFLQARLP